MFVPLLPKTEVEIHRIPWESSVPKKASCPGIQGLRLVRILLVISTACRGTISFFPSIGSMLQCLGGISRVGLIEVSDVLRVSVFSVA